MFIVDVKQLNNNNKSVWNHDELGKSEAKGQLDLEHTNRSLTGILENLRTSDNEEE